MQVYNVSKKLYESLIKYEVKSINTEGELFIVPEKDKWNNSNAILKKLYIDEGTYFSNKLFTINELMSHENEINMKELVLPQKLAIHDDKVVGFTMDLINGINLDELLANTNYSLEFKKELLIQIGELLERLKIIRQYSSISDLYISDLHEGNIIYNLKTGKLNVVDMDSCKINGNKPFPAKYLSKHSPINNYPFKYKQNEDENKLANYIPNENSDYYCYTIIVLNYLLGTNATRLTLEEFYSYLDYLIKLGYDKELITKISEIYSAKDNENIYNYLETLPTDYKVKALSRYDIFKSKTK